MKQMFFLCVKRLTNRRTKKNNMILFLDTIKSDLDENMFKVYIIKQMWQKFHNQSSLSPLESLSSIRYLENKWPEINGQCTCNHLMSKAHWFFVLNLNRYCRSRCRASVYVNKFSHDFHLISLNAPINCMTFNFQLISWSEINTKYDILVRFCGCCCCFFFFVNESFSFEQFHSIEQNLFWWINQNWNRNCHCSSLSSPFFIILSYIFHIAYTTISTCVYKCVIHIVTKTQINWTK